MLAKITSKNQLTLPKSITDQIALASGPLEYFDVQSVNGQIVLTPVRIQRGDAVRAKLAELAIRPSDIEDAVRWARDSSRQTR
jgi:bifunctional DNA-binding transcriptional regulator/antitoxin component of YhaV-PrlF toxin-antitoxin module